MISVRPPAATATTARPLAMASRATKPRVSVSEGIMKMSALAYAADRSSPLSMPCTTHQHFLAGNDAQSSLQALLSVHFFKIAYAFSGSDDLTFTRSAAPPLADGLVYGGSDFNITCHAVLEDPSCWLTLWPLRNLMSPACAKWPPVCGSGRFAWMSFSLDASD